MQSVAVPWNQQVVQMDPLSTIARNVLKINAEHAYASLLPRIEGNSQAKSLLDSSSAGDMLAVGAVNLDDATLVRSALYLWHDWLEESHKLSQSISTATGSFWHAIMHRREGDFSNSKYWYARCAEHPVFAVLAAQAGQVLNPLPVDKSILKLTLGGWNPNALVDLVETAVSSGAEAKVRIAVSLQQLEWRVLFDHTVRSAAGDQGAQVFHPAG